MDVGDIDLRLTEQSAQASHKARDVIVAQHQQFPLRSELELEAPNTDDSRITAAIESSLDLDLSLLSFRVTPIKCE